MAKSDTEKKTPDEARITESFQVVVDALTPLTPVERQRVIKAACVLLDVSVGDW